MATSINVRLSDDLEKQLKSTIEEVKTKTPRGAEVNNSTIVRGALEEFIKKNEDSKKGIVNFSAPFGKLEKEDLEKVIELVQKLVNSVDKTELTDGEHMLISLLTLIELEIKGIYITK